VFKEIGGGFGGVELEGEAGKGHALALQGIVSRGEKKGAGRVRVVGAA
jgi:hypothetical protein